MSEHDRQERPIEWLRSLEEGRFAYANLLTDSGCLAVAAHRIASARCRSSATPSEIPTAMELGAAAIEVARRAPCPGPLPKRGVLAEQCEAEGLPVICPLGARRAA